MTGIIRFFWFLGDDWSSTFTVDRKSRDRGPTFYELKIWIGGGWASHPYINRDRSIGGNHLLSSSRSLLLRNSNFFFPCCAAMSSSLLFIKWRKEKKWEKDKEMVIVLSSKEFGKCVTLVIMKGLLRHINRRDGCHCQRRSARRTDGASVNPSRGILLFLLVGQSLFTGDLESLRLVVVLLLGGTGVQTWFLHCLACLARARLVGHHCWSPGGLPESPHPSRNARGIVVPVRLPWSHGEWKGRGVPGWDILSDAGVLVFSSPKPGSLAVF